MVAPLAYFKPIFEAALKVADLALKGRDIRAPSLIFILKRPF